MTPRNEEERSIMRRYRKDLLLGVRKLKKEIKEKDMSAYHIKHLCDGIECLAFEAVNSILENRGEQ